MCDCKFIVLILLSLLLSACQKPFIAADVIINDAHGGGSVVQFNQQETLLASGGWEGYIRFWDLPSGKKHFSWKAHLNEVTGIAFINGDENTVSTGHDAYIKIWNSKGRLIRQVITQSPIRSMAVDENLQLLVSGHMDGSVQKWHLQDLTKIEQSKHHHNAVRAVALDPSGLIASSASSGDTLLWTPDGQIIELPSTPSDIRSLAFAEQGKVLLGGGWFNLYRWTLSDTRKNNNLAVLKTEHHGIIRNIEMLRDGENLASISRQTDSAVLFLDPLSGEVKQRFQPHDLCGADVTVSSHQTYMATTSDDASVRIWQLKPGQSAH